MSQQNQWDSSAAFIFAMIGAAVGLGNIWRFSYVLYSNGGGSFFIPYLIAILIMGIPFLILEYGVGFTFRQSFSSIMKKIDPKFEIIAWILVLLVFVVTIYYMVILSWDLVYLASSFTFSWGVDTAQYFVSTVGGSSNLSNANFLLIPTAVGVIIMWIALWFIAHRNVDKGIGRVSKILIPALFVIMGFIIIYALTLPGAGIGVNTLLTPDWSKLADVNIWLAAFAQIIFSLSMGQAIATTYASYLPENSKLINNVFIVVASNSLFEICTAHIHRFPDDIQYNGADWKNSGTSAVPCNTLCGNHFSTRFPGAYAEHHFRQARMVKEENRNCAEHSGLCDITDSHIRHKQLSCRHNRHICK